MRDDSAPLTAAGGGFAMAVRRGLSRRAKRLPCKYLYDETGCGLFERICELDEYYLTRAERALLTACAPDIARRAGPGARVVELGGSSEHKARLLLSALREPEAYMPVDLARPAVEAAAARLKAHFPRLTVAPLCADFRAPLPRPAGLGPVLVFFPGSSIGNLSPHQSALLLRNARALAGRRGGMLVGVDLKKDPRLLDAAYNDRHGVSAAFNLNILARINRELEGDADLAAFSHRARYVAGRDRVEIDIVSLRRQVLRADGGHYAFGRGEAIRTEVSYKYSIDEFHTLARNAGFRPAATFEDGMFSLHWLVGE